MDDPKVPPIPETPPPRAGMLISHLKGNQKSNVHQSTLHTDFDTFQFSLSESDQW
jgi:hypothetical protein